MPARVYALDHQGKFHVFHYLAKSLANGETWELEKDMQEKYPELFTNKCMNFEDEILLRGRECDDWKIRSYFLKIPFYFDSITL